MLIESLILNYDDIFPSHRSQPVKEISIDFAIEQSKNSPEPANDDDESKLQRLQITDDGEETVDDKDQDYDDILSESSYLTLCDRHKKLVNPEYERYGAELSSSGGSSQRTRMKKVMQSLGRIVSFRNNNGSYQVNNVGEAAVNNSSSASKYATSNKIRRPTSSVQKYSVTRSTSPDQKYAVTRATKKNVCCNDQSSTEYNYFQGKQSPAASAAQWCHYHKLSPPANNNLSLDVENVIKQFEFLEDELNNQQVVTNEHQKDSVEEDLGICHDTANDDNDDVAGNANFGDDILQQLETLQNSVKEVNDMFDSGINSGIFYAELVHVNWLINNN